MTLEQALPEPRVGPDLPPELWNTLFGWIPGTEAVSAPTPAPAVVVGGLVALFGVVVWRWRRRSRTPIDQSEVREATLSSMLQEENRQTGAEHEAGSSIGSEVGPGDTDAGMGETFQDISESHDDLMAASAIESETRTANVGGEYTKTLHIQDMDEQPSDGLLSPLWELTGANFDVTVYFTEKNQSIARENLRDRADDLQVDADDEDSSRSNYLQDEANKAAANHEAAESGTKVFDFSMWVTVRGDTLEELEENERKVRRALREDPASLVPKTAIGKQVQAIQSAAPLGPDILGDKDPEYYKMPLMAGGVGAFLASPTNPTFTEPTGIEVGKHKTTQTPVIVDPTERENGHAWFLIADVGSGKSVTGKTAFTRLITQREDTQGVILEPLGNWDETAEALDAEHFVIGGTKGINPLKIEPIPDNVRREMAPSENPLGRKVEDVLGFLKNYFSMRGLESQFAERRTVAESAVQDAYERAGITEDISTFSNDNPTIRGEVADALRDREENPGEYTESEHREDDIRDDASWLLRHLQPFMEGGQYENLGGESNIDIRGAETIYLDLGQSEGQVSEKAALTMQLLVLEVYEMAKQIDDWLVFAMDEFRYILRDAANLEFMETLFRHHRHQGIIPMIMTQTVDEFLQHPESETILDQCTIKQFLALDGMDKEIAEEFSLNPAQARFVAHEAEAGSEELGYADSLIGIDGDWRQIEVHTLPKEHEVVDGGSDDGGTTPDQNGIANESSTPAKSAETDGGRGVTHDE